MCSPFNGECDAVEAAAAGYRAEKAAGKHQIPGFNTVRLRNENEAGLTQQQMHRETIDDMIRTGREEQIGMKN
jgi:hypothetical protein|tara:strand:- start:47 stop:265 length:219 start_codon:yes stop_codon:yes gene_type:complete